MYCNQQITDTLFWTGVNDRRKQLFENLWPLPGGVSYNSFLIRDQKCALMDTVEAGSDRGYLDWIGSVLGDRPLDYLIIHHMELDHSGEIENLLQRYPDVKIVGNIKTFKVLCGYLGQLPNMVEVKDGDTLDLGHHRLKFIFTPWVHWPETMMTYDQTDGILFTGDAFGSFGALDGGEDGLMFYRAIVRHWTQILRPGGWLMFEVGEDQADAVMALMTEEKYTDVTALEDTAGIRRVVVGRI